MDFYWPSVKFSMKNVPKNGTSPPSKTSSEVKLTPSKSNYLFTSDVNLQIFPLVGIIMLTIAEFCIHYIQRSIRQWLTYLDYNVEKRKYFYNSLLVAESVPNILAFLLGSIADSYTGKYILYLSGSVVNVLISIGFFCVSFYEYLSWETTLVLFISSVYGLLKAVRSALYLEQVRIPKYIDYLDKHTFWLIFAKNAGKSASILCYTLLGTFLSLFINTYLGINVIVSLLCLALVYFCRTLIYHEEVYYGIYPKTTQCACYCLMMKFKNRNSKDKLPDWIEYATGKYDKVVIDSAKPLLKLPIIFLPLMFNSLMRGSLLTVWEQQLRLLRPNLVGVSLSAMYAHFSTVSITFVHFCIKPQIQKIHLFSTDIALVSLGYFLLAVSVLVTGITQHALLYYFKVNEFHVSHSIVYNELDSSSVLFWRASDVVVPLDPKSMFDFLHYDIKNSSEIVIEVHNQELGLHLNETIPIKPEHLSFHILTEHGLMKIKGFYRLFPLRNRFVIQTFIININEYYNYTLTLVPPYNSPHPSTSATVQSSSVKELDTKIGEWDIYLQNLVTNRSHEHVKGVFIQRGGIYAFIVSEESEITVDVFSLYHELNDLFMLMLTLQFLLTVTGDCIMMPALAKFGYLNAPRKLRATVNGFAPLAEGLGRLALAGLEVSVSIGYNTTMIYVWTTVIFTVYIIYIYLVIRVNVTNKSAVSEIG